MAEEEKGRQGPRQLEVWYSGEVPQGRWDVFARTRHALVQTICLTTNKRAKTVPQIAEEVQAHATYVADAVRELADLEVLTSPRKGQYRLSFIAFEAADWRRVTTHVRQPAAEAAHRMVQAEGALRDAFAKTPLSKAGWTWQDVCWVIYCFCLATRGAARAAPAVPQTAPMRPGGVRYWLGGHEWTDDMSRLYTTSFCGGDMGGQGAGYFGTSAGHEGHLWLFEEPYRALNLLRALLDGPRGEDDLLAQIQDEPEQQRAALARLVEASLVEAAGGRLRVTMPVFGGADSDLLTPVLDGIAAPIMREVVMPTWADLDRMLDDMGYGHHRDQYRLWHRWLEAYVMGEALRFLGEQDVLPRITDDAPAKWVFVAWKGDLPLMSMQAEK